MSFEKPTAIFFYDPFFLAIFVLAAVMLLLMRKKLKIRLNTASLYILFFVLLATYVTIRGIYE
jgi:hypothetical protein